MQIMGMTIQHCLTHGETSFVFVQMEDGSKVKCCQECLEQVLTRNLQE